MCERHIVFSSIKPSQPSKHGPSVQCGRRVSRILSSPYIGGELIDTPMILALIEESGVDAFHFGDALKTTSRMGSISRQLAERYSP